MSLEQYVDFESIYKTVTYSRLALPDEKQNNVERHILKNQKNYILSPDNCEVLDTLNVMPCFKHDDGWEEDIIWEVDTSDGEVLSWSKGPESVEWDE